MWGQVVDSSFCACLLFFIACCSAGSILPPPLPLASHCLLQRQILDKLREHERGIDAEVEEIITERRRCREVMVRWQCS